MVPGSQKEPHLGGQWKGAAPWTVELAQVQGDRDG